MAEAPRWRYTRKSIPVLEKVLSLAVLLVLLAVAGLFLWDMQRPQGASPFAVDPKLISEAARPAEVVAAGYLLPSGTVAKRQGLPEAVSGEALASKNAALGEAAGQYRARHAVVARYDVGGVPVTAAVLELSGPEWAFGLWAARKPAEARVMAVGATGQAWRSDSAAGFWAGRHYVEVWTEGAVAAAGSEASSSAGEAGGAVDPVAVALAELGRAHVFYGRPFAAEGVLPQEGLKGDSLRFAPADALGVKGLEPALVAEYEGEVRVAAVVMGSAEQAKTAAEALVRAGGEGAEGQAEPAVDGQGRGTIGTGDGSAVVVQAVDRFVVAATGEDGGAVAGVLDGVARNVAAARSAAALSAAAGSAAGGPGAGGARKQAGPLPTLQGDLAGPGEVRRFNPDTLYEKINGKAQLYLSYSFAELLFTTYAAGDVSLDVYVYDMSQADNAFGIFKAEESEDGEAAPVGRGGYYSGSSVFFWKGKYYVNVLASAGAGGDGHGEGEGHGEGDGHEGTGGEGARPAALKLALAIAEQMTDSGQSLWAEQVLPAENRVADSFEFRKSDAFGLEFLKDVFSAQYKHGEKELTVFVTRTASPGAAQEVLRKYQEFTGKYGKVLENATVGESPLLVAENTGTYDAVFARGNYFGGVTAADDRELAKSVVVKWLETFGAAGGK